MSNANLANALLGAAVGTSDTTITLQSGYAASMPVVPFKLTGTPFGQLPTTGNSEIMRATAVSGNTFTVTRAIDGTTAHSFAVGDIVANGIYVEDVQPTLVSGTNIMTVGGQDILGAGNANIPLSGINGGSTAGVLQTTSSGVVSSGLVSASNIDFTTITLGYAQVTSTWGTASTVYAQVTGLSVATTIPAGVNRVKVTFHCWAMTVSSTNLYVDVGMFDGAVSSTPFQFAEVHAVDGQPQGPSFSGIYTVTPGTAHTFNIGCKTTSGTTDLVANTSGPMYILVESC